MAMACPVLTYVLPCSYALAMRRLVLTYAALRVPYAMSGTEAGVCGYQATERLVRVLRTHGEYKEAEVRPQAMSGTDIACGEEAAYERAMRCSVLPYRMVLALSYGIPGNGMMYGASCLRLSYAMPGTDGAT
eukprot:1392396-Rhodomonas_salina.2